MEECVFNFDLDFLQHHQSSATVEQPIKDEKYERCRKALINVKKRIIPTSALVYRFKELKNVLEVTERNLVASKEESKEMCIDYKNVLEKCSTLENERQYLVVRSQELETKNEHAETCVAAMHSHVRQLQVLVKELETQVEALKIESRLDKNNARECERKMLLVQKSYENVKSDISLIADVLLKKDKLTREHKILLRKYRSSVKKENGKECDIVEDDSENSDKEEFEEVSSSDSKSNLVSTTEEHIRKSDVNKMKIKDKASSSPDDGYSDCSNEVVSEDTGRGSSLTNSAFQSPEHFSEGSPLNADYPTNCDKVKINIISSQTITSSKSSINLVNEKAEIIATKVENIFVTRATSPIFKVPLPDIVVDPVSEEAGNDENETFKSNDYLENDSHAYFEDDNLDTFEDANDVEPEVEETSTQPQPTDENSNIDCEVQMILKQMTLRQELITPFPSSPSRSSYSGSSNIKRTEPNELMQDSAIMQEQNADLQSKYESLKSQYDTLSSNHDNVLTQLDAINLKHDRLEKDFQAFKTLMLRHVIMGSVGQFSINQTETFIEEDNICDLNQRNIEEIQSEGKFSHQEQICEGSQLNLSYNSVENEPNGGNHNEEELFYVANTQDELMTMEDLYPENNVNHDTDDSDSDETVVLRIDAEASDHEESTNTENIEETFNINSNKVTAKCSENYDNNINSKSDERIQEVLDDSDEDVNCIRSPLRKRLVFEETEEIENLHTDEIIPESPVSTLNTSVDLHYEKEDKVVKRTLRAKRLSKLEKMRERVLRKKNKIRPEQPPPRKKLARKVKQIRNEKEKSSKQALDSSQLNDKNIYENAIKIMTELRAKEEEKVKRQAQIRPRRKLRSMNKPTSETPKRQEIGDDATCDQKDTSNACQLETPHISRKRPSVELIDNDTPSKRVLRSSNNRNSYLNESNSKHKDIKKTDTSCDQRKSATNEEEASSRRNSAGNPLGKYTVIDEVGYTSDVSDKPLVEYADMELFEEQSTGSEKANSDKFNETSKQKEKKLKKQVPKERRRISVEKPIEVGYTSDVSDKPLVEYNDIELFEDQSTNSDKAKNVKASESIKQKEKKQKKQVAVDVTETSILKMGLRSYARCRRQNTKKVSSTVIGRICKQIEDRIKEIVELGTHEIPQEKTRQEMDKLVTEILKMNIKHFIKGLIQYLKDPERKVEFFSKASVFRAPPMTKAQQVILYVLSKLKSHWEDVIENVLSSIEFELFQLNHAPEFEQIETMSHFYAVLCRYTDARSRLRLFVLDAMYCLQFKALPLIKQCIDVWMHIIPLAHSELAKQPLTQCLVYLLHFYKCRDDRFNRASDIRFLLYKRYQYQFSDWSEDKIIKMLRSAVMRLRDDPVERKMLRLALIIVAKRRGARWCHDNIVKRLIVPVLEDVTANHISREFCAGLVGVLLRPYPVEMRIDCEVAINRLFTLLEHDPSQQMQEAVYRSLMQLNRHSSMRVMRALLAWTPTYTISEETRDMLRDYVRERPRDVWKGQLTKLSKEID